jgi:hypothetical protein
MADPSWAAAAENLMMMAMAIWMALAAFGLAGEAAHAVHVAPVVA